jgi:hypothetical protein
MREGGQVLRLVFVNFRKGIRGFRVYGLGLITSTPARTELEYLGALHTLLP